MAYDVIIIGAGPAGLFAAYELSRTANLKIAIIEKGEDISKRKGVMSGVGGAGLFSDGKLNLTPVHGKTDLFEFLAEKQAYELIEYINKVFIEFGAPKEYYTKNIDKAVKLKQKAKKHGIGLLLLKQKHIGSDRLKILIGKFVKELKKRGVQIILNTEVTKFLVKNKKVTGVKTNKGAFNSHYIIACPGRIGSKWMIEQANKLRIPIKHRGIEVGIRIEVPAKLMKPITDIIWDPAFFIKTERYNDQVRTFCTCPYGFIAKETYQGFIGVNGYCRTDRKSKNTNFALLANVELTKPATDTITYGEFIGKLATTIAGGKPFLQRYADLISHRRSNPERIKKSKTKPTLKDSTPGDLSMAMPNRVVINIIDALNKLDNIMPGLTNNALLYGPEIKFFSVKVQTNKSLETKIKNLFIAGDGVGVSGNIVGAAATGVIAARGVMKNKSR